MPEKDTFRTDKSPPGGRRLRLLESGAMALAPVPSAPAPDGAAPGQAPGGVEVGRRLRTRRADAMRRQAA
jgi:hypothetical protein